ncbi:hypothetical protein [Rathayibacter iranicus]|nr:hypothetical protein [Rathayibacter iranicus]
MLSAVTQLVAGDETSYASFVNWLPASNRSGVAPEAWSLTE